MLYNVVQTSLTSNITYNALNGSFTITQPGHYYFSWWISAGGAATATTLSFVLVGSNGVSIPSASASATGEVSGSALVNVTAPAVFQLVNRSGDTVTLPVLSAQANMLIMHIAP